jgi:hypothetical protein
MLRADMRRFLFFLTALVPATALASGTEHSDPVASVALALVIILAAAKLGGELAVRAGQPAVLGELVAGVALGNLSLVGIAGLDPLWSSPSVDMLARLGVLVLLFEVGLSSTVGQMMKVGGPSLVVATLGVLTPFGLGWATSAWLLPSHSAYVHAFVGATLCATSVGITARVFQDLGRIQTTEARIILGAAVIDDVMGLVVLAVVGGVITAAGSGAGFSYSSAGLIVLKALVFLVGALFIGVYLSRRLFRLASRLKARGVLLSLSLAWCFGLAWPGWCSKTCTTEISWTAASTPSRSWWRRSPRSSPRCSSCSWASAPICAPSSRRGSSAWPWPSPSPPSSASRPARSASGDRASIG